MHVDPSIFQEYEAVIGLEIHVQLNTKSKLFSSAPNRFGDEPNTNITEICTGQPGALPTLNKEAVKKAVLFGCAVNGSVATYSHFDRKSYFYPDSPRNFQITQFDHPIIQGGTLIADVEGVPKSFSINRAHLEDDAGMLKHFTDFAGVDYNRAGAPLIEIVSEPCMFSPKEAVAYAIGMRALLQYIDVSDCNMEEGSLRIDANISVRRKGEKALRNKIEIKNMNSFNFLGLALEAEFKRQVSLYESHPTQPIDSLIKPATYRWDVEKKEAVMMRPKESADDYRYFLEPDLPPLIVEQEYIDAIRSTIGELPYQKEKRYIQQYHLAPELASLIINERSLATYFEQALVVTSNAKGLCNWIVGEFGGRLKENYGSIVTSGIPPENVGQLVNMIDNGTITGPIAKKIADIMVADPKKSCEEIVRETPQFQPISNEKELRIIIIEVLENNKQSVEDYRGGKEKAFGFLVGQVMQATKGKASPIIVNSLLKELLN